MKIQSNKNTLIHFKSNSSDTQNNNKTWEPAPIDVVLFDKKRVLNNTPKQNLLDMTYLAIFSIGIGLFSAAIILLAKMKK